MNAAPTADSDAFAAWLDGSGFEAALRRQHLVRVLTCLGAAAGAIAFNLLGHVAPPWPHALVLQGMMTLSVGGTFGSWFLITWRLERDAVFLKTPQPTLETRAASVATYLARRDLLMLSMAVAGCALITLATVVGVRIPGAIDTLIVLINLLPTFQFLWLGAKEMPDRKRLMTLYRVVARAKPPA